MEIIKLTKENLNRTLKLAAKAIVSNKVIVSPTDTVYGMLTSAKSKVAVEKLHKIKKRGKKPLPIFVKDISAAKRLAILPKKNEHILKKAWPGKTTFVLEKNPKISLFGAGKKTIALRIPKHPFVLSLLDVLKIPLTGTSANVSGMPASGKIKEILEQFKNSDTEPDLIIDAGNLKQSKPSKIIDLTKTSPKILRT